MAEEDEVPKHIRLACCEDRGLWGDGVVHVWRLRYVVLSESDVQEGVQSNWISPHNKAIFHRWVCLRTQQQRGEELMTRIPGKSDPIEMTSES